VEGVVFFAVEEGCAEAAIFDAAAYPEVDKVAAVFRCLVVQHAICFLGRREHSADEEVVDVAANDAGGFGG
jgi:hypothetical protein